MRTIKNPVEFREKIREHLRKMLLTPESMAINTSAICLNLERGIYNYCIQEATARNIVKKWENGYFVHIYLDRLRSIYINLKNSDLRDRLLGKIVKAHEVAFMTHQIMCPSKWTKMLEEKKVRDENKYAPKIEASTDNFTCRKCKSKECSYYQMQTRSADEPMTTFVSCNKCGNRWKC
jgi:transcription elongation factor S-II